MSIARAALFHYAMPLRAPLILARGALEQRDGLLLRVTDGQGRHYWGEAAPLPGFSRETLQEVEAQLRALAGACTGMHWAALGEAIARRRSAGAPSVRCALDMLWHQVTLPEGARHHAEPISLTCLLAYDADPAAAARAAVQAGYPAVKLKVGRRPLDADIALARAVAAELPAGVSLRLDANRAWDLETAVAFCSELERLWSADAQVLEFIEEPLQHSRDLPQLARHTGVPIALDETLAEDLDAQALEMLLPHVRALVWKPTLSGLSLAGITALAKRTSPPLPVVVSAAFESGLALQVFGQYASALPLRTPAGLDTYRWLQEDVLRTPLPLPAPSLDLSALAWPVVDTPRLRLLHDG